MFGAAGDMYGSVPALSRILRCGKGAGSSSGGCSVLPGRGDPSGLRLPCATQGTGAGTAPLARAGVGAPLCCYFPFLCDAQGVDLCSQLQLRGISAFEGTKPAFSVCHFTARFFVPELQKRAAETMHALRRGVSVTYNKSM